MCGIVGLRLKNAELESHLGELVVPMLDLLASRGPDSTGVAIYARDVSPGQAKYSLCAPEEDYNWGGFAAQLEEELASAVALRRRGRDAIVVSRGAAESRPGRRAAGRPAGTALRARIGDGGLQGRRARDRGLRPLRGRGDGRATRRSATPAWRRNRR